MRRGQSWRARGLALVLLAAGAACTPAAPATPAPSVARVPDATAVAGTPAPAATAATPPMAAAPETSPNPRGAAPTSATSAAATEEAVVLVGAGDIADCDSDGAQRTAALLEEIAGTVFTLGDNAYPAGSSEEYQRCYAPTWGRFKARTRPAVGNHEYVTPGAAGYFAYFGAAAGDPATGYYSYDLGAWHVIVLNGNCSEVGGCGSGSAQQRWLAADLAAHPAFCTLAYWHQPRFSSGPHASDGAYRPFWQMLYEAGADVVLNGHDHIYERFLPQTPGGLPDAARGIRQFTVGTGGASQYGIAFPLATSDVRNGQVFGVLKLTLHPRAYDWEFVPVADESFTDAGSGRCH